MLNDRWAKRILRAAKTDVMTSSSAVVEGKILSPTSGNIAIGNTDDAWRNFNGYPYGELSYEGKKLMKVKNNEKLMNYLQQENACGHAHNLDMLIASVNVNQHMREAILSSSVTEDLEANCYTISFPFGEKTIEFKLSMRAVDNE